MTINEAYQLVTDIGNKQQGIGFLPPDIFNTYAQRAQMQVVQEHLKVLDQTQQCTDIMKSLFIETIINVNSQGWADYPLDYMRMASMRKYWYSGEIGEDPLEVPVDEVTNAGWAERISSQLRKPTYRFPVCTLAMDYFECSPKNIGSVILDYYQYPAPPVYGFIIINNRPVYDPATSVQFTIPDEAHNEICFHICSYLGMTITMPMLVQYADQQAQMNH